MAIHVSVALRAGSRIHECLSKPRFASSRIDLPVDTWCHCQDLTRRLEKAAEHGWYAAAARVSKDLDWHLEYLREQVREVLLRNPVDDSGPVSTPKQIADDLVALNSEFEEVELDMRARTITVRTDAIELEGLDLGSFRIVLSWGMVGLGCAYEVVAVEPNPANRDDDIVHPHVQGNSLCEGDARVPIRRALEQGRLFDFFLIVRQTLETYNSGSAYVAIDEWNGTRCSDCDWTYDPDEGYSCFCCASSVCGECVTTCTDCEALVCGECKSSCEKCDLLFCQTCLKSCSECGADCCKECLSDGKCCTCRDADNERRTIDASERPEAAQCAAATDAPLHADCVGEVSVPA